VSSSGRKLVAVLAALLAADIAHALLGFGGPALDDLFSTWLHNGLMAVAAVLCLVRAVRGPGEQMAWAWAGGALALYALGEATWSAFYSGMEEPPYPGLSDAFWLGWYPAIYVALVLLVRRRVREFHASLWMDGVIAGLAVAGVGAALAFDPVLAATGGERAAAVATTIAYPLADLVLLGFVVGVFALTGWRPGRSWCLIAAALGFLAVGDAVYSYQSAQGTWVDGSIWDTMFPAGALLLAYAAWQPGEAERAIVLDGARLLVVPFAFALVGVGLVAFAMLDPVNGVAHVLALATLVAVLVRTGLTFAENLRILRRVREDSLTDALTGLGNRRRLLADLEAEVTECTAQRPSALVLFDLDGFKSYNDTYGHPAGDAMLARLGRNLDAVTRPFGRAYRLGGDEFCVLVREQAAGFGAIVAATSAALAEAGEGFSVTSSHGLVVLPSEAADASEALQIADRRMYGQKNGRPSSAGRQTRDVLLRVLREREPDLHEHMREVSRLAVAVGRRLGMEGEALDELARAAELHDVGKMAIPDAILNKPGPLDADETEFMRRHTVIGERILGAAPALTPVAKLVRFSHERMDGQGYPDGLAGDEIPLGARVIAVCDAYAAMTEDRPYREALRDQDAVAELRRCAGSQFDARVVELFVEELEAQPSAVAAARSVASKSVFGMGPTQGEIAPESA
jgi:diguanylate cyclase (GGDEF)-like protein